MEIKKIIFIILMLGALWVVWKSPAPSLALAQEDIVIHTAQGDVPFTVEIAETETQQMLGLMHRTSLAPDRGMLFLWPREKRVEMWMKDTEIPLDMLFIRKDGTVAEIAPSRPPESLDIVAAHQPVAAVLELGGGVSKAKHIQNGDTIVSPHFSQHP